MSAPQEPHYCPNCGAEHHPGARFCERCGADFEAPVAAAPPGGADEGRGPRWPVVAAIVAGVLAVGAVAALIVVLLGNDDESKDSPYRDRVAAILEPVGTANDDLSDRLEGLKKGDDAGDAIAAARRAAVATGAARRGITGLSSPKDERRLRSDVDDALARQRTWVIRVRAALGDPSSSAARRLPAAAAAAREAWRDVAEEIPGAGGRVAGEAKLAAWAVDAAGETPADDQEPTTTPTTPPTTTTAPPEPQTEACGSFEGVVDITATGVDCDTARRVAVTVAGNPDSGGAEGFSCISSPAGDQTQWACNRPDDEAAVNFAVFE